MQKNNKLNITTRQKKFSLENLRIKGIADINVTILKKSKGNLKLIKDSRQESVNKSRVCKKF